LLKNKIRKIRDFLDYLFVSLDGIGALHDKLRGMEGSFGRAIDGIKEAKKIFTCINKFHNHKR
jgi:MoaA/NifB/PqqE/SkfB family radical SAM enzyme